jgi:hypothetical protein
MGQAWVKDDGLFEIPEVPPGRYTLRTLPVPSLVVTIDVARSDVAGIELMLRGPATPLNTPLPPPRPSPLNIARPSTPLVPPAGLGMVSIAQNGRYPREWREGAMNYFRIERAGTVLEEKPLEGPLNFMLASGSYELRTYSRACDGNCGRLDPPDIQCTASFTVSAGQVLYAERVIQDATCTIRLKP